MYDALIDLAVKIDNQRKLITQFRFDISKAELKIAHMDIDGVAKDDYHYVEWQHHLNNLHYKINRAITQECDLQTLLVQEIERLSHE